MSPAPQPTGASLTAQELRRRWWRFCTQFSLRTLLGVMTLAAVGCWWFLQPQTRDEQLAGKYLKLRRQVRIEEIGVLEIPAKMVLSNGHLVKMINSGGWQLRDEHDGLLVSGRYENDQPQGRWTTYHTNGRKAVEGDVFHGARSGPWRVWDEEGRLLSEMTYAAKAENVLMGGMGGGPMAQKGPNTQLRFLTRREGAARAWYPNGKIRSEGNYRNDRRSGPWTFSDEQGHVTNTKEY